MRYFSIHRMVTMVQEIIEIDQDWWNYKSNI